MAVFAINQKRKTSYAKRSLKTKQHTTSDELESHNPMPANHIATPFAMAYHIYISD